MRSKRARLCVVIAVLALCFSFLWPSLCWYAWTPKEEQNLALGSLEKIKDYATDKANSDIDTIFGLARANPDALLGPEYSWLEKIAKKNYKLIGEKVNESMTVATVLEAFDSREELLSVFEGRYRDRILKNKEYYENAVKLGLDLSGGMNVIVKADLDSVIAAQKNADTSVSDDVLKKQAMEQAIENLTSRIDRFGLSNPVIRQQGEDRIYIELPGAAEADQINSIIMGRGILNFRLVDDEATNSFMTYYASNPNGTFDAAGNLIDSSIIPDDCELFGYYVKDDYGLDERIGFVVVKKEVVLDGQHIKSAEVGTENITNRPQVNFVLDSEGAEIFGNFTASHVNQSMAIVSDNKVKSRANINEPIPGGRVAISGFSLNEAQNLQKVLQTAWLTVPLSVESQQVIGASLGETAIHQGAMALTVGLLLILVFMLRANPQLVHNVLYFVGFQSYYYAF